jgi:hypothetical protein
MSLTLSIHLVTLLVIIRLEFKVLKLYRHKFTYNMSLTLSIHLVTLLVFILKCPADVLCAADNLALQKCWNSLNLKSLVTKLTTTKTVKIFTRHMLCS